MDADIAIRWMSEVRGGRLSRLRKDIRWFAEDESTQGRKAVDRWIQNLVTMGFVDVDWGRDEWVIADPSLTTIPGGYGYALLVGARHQRLTSELARARDLDDPVLVEVPGTGSEKDLPSPSSIFVAYRTFRELSSASDRLGVRLASGVYRQLAQQLVRVSPGEETVPPSRSGGLIERWKPGDGKFCSYPDNDPWIAGLYKQEVNKFPRYMIFRNDQWFRTERSAGIYLVTAPAYQLIRWVPELSLPSGQMGSLLVDKAVDLPDAQRRVAGLCSGLPPYVSRIRGGSIRYHNIPLEIAQTIASSLGHCQKDTVMQSEIGVVN
ncbi:hypothetical protein DFR70_105361 [Nocardia tenerifensis]|uniref:Uncharacterized protein n=1 Tax=Nocardia tenerifensis TaxID=228006 RepID=A0A318K443_9NOCA|nr:hypothetical protein [Nocardia tenerifensis]PXX64176.1 hypothetical protein DFR70_105361 [Nocardia tenerifensis]